MLNNTTLNFDFFNTTSNSSEVSADGFNYSLVVRVTLALCLTAISIALFFVLLLVFYARYREYEQCVPVEEAIKDDPSVHPSCALLTNGYQRRVVVLDGDQADQQEPSTSSA